MDNVVRDLVNSCHMHVSRFTFGESDSESERLALEPMCLKQGQDVITRAVPKESTSLMRAARSNDNEGADPSSVRDASS